MRIQFQNLKWLDFIEYLFPNQELIKFRLAFNMLDRDTGRPQLLYAETICSRSEFSSTEDIIEQVRHVAKEFVVHEVDECLLLDRKRIFDPHKKK